MMSNFITISKIGEGAYSTVLRVKRITDNQEYAMKIVKLGQLKPKEKENALNEIRLLASIQDPYIIGYKEAFFDEANLSLNIVMEFATGGDLSNKIKDHQKAKQYISERYIWKMIYQMLMGLKTLHSVGILHRDIKSANVFIMKEKNFKLGDMNVSKVVNQRGLAYTQTGTPYYASPEVWRDQPYSSKSDIWSLGCVSYEMAALKPPFRAADMETLYKKVLRGKVANIPELYSGDLQQIILLCLKVNVQDRPSSENLLRHPLIHKQCSEWFIRSEQQQILLKTIRIPKNLRDLKQKLPKAKYSMHQSFQQQIKLPQIRESGKSQPTKEAKQGDSNFVYEHKNKYIIKRPAYQQSDLSSVQDNNSNVRMHVKNSYSIGNNQMKVGQQVQKRYQRPEWWG